MFSRRHGWQRPLHPLQMVGMGVYTLLLATFFCFLAPFLGDQIAKITVITLYSSVAVSVMALFIRCTATDPSDKTRRRHQRKASNNNIKKKKKCCKLNYGFMMGHILIRAFRRMERYFLNTCIRRKYLRHPGILAPPNPLHLQQPLLSFPLVTELDSEPLQDQDVSFCPLCNFQVLKHSKHCRTCNRCVEGFDHHCRWLNNCVGKKNYTTFILLMLSLLFMFLMEGGTAIVVIIRCFADKKRIEQEVARELHPKFPRAILITISVILLLVTAYGEAALAKLFFFHLLLIRKGIRTYDYILAMREEHHFNAELLSDSDFSSDDSSEPDSPTNPIVMTQFSPRRLSVKIDPESSASILKQNQGFRASIDPWKLIQMSKEKAFMAAEKAKERLEKEKQMGEPELLHPLPFEMKSGPLVNPERDLNFTGLSLTPLITKGRVPGSPGRFSSPRRRFSGSPATVSNTTGVPNQKYKSNFDLKLTDVSKELESYISRQVLCSVFKDGTEASPK